MVNSLDDSRNILADSILLFFYAIYIFTSIIQGSMLGYTMVVSNSFSVAIGIFMAFVSIIFKRHNIYDVFWLVISSTIVLISILSTNASSKPMILTVLIIFSLSNVDPKKVLLTSAISIGSMLSFIYLLSCLGVISNLVFFRDGIGRQSLGMIYPLTFSAYLFFFAVTITILFGQKYSKTTVLGLIVLVVISYFVNQARNDSLMMMLLILAVVISKYFSSITKFFSKFYVFFMIIVAVITPFITNLLRVGSSTYSLIDRVASGRLYLQTELLSNFKPTLFGQYIFENGNGGPIVSLLPYFYIDSSFTKLVFFDGILFFLMFVVTWIVRIHTFNRHHLYFMSMIFAIVWIDGITQESLSLPEFNILFGLLLTNVDYFNNFSNEGKFRS